MQSSTESPPPSAIEQRLRAVSERLREIERRKAAVDARQDDIDRLAFETIATMVDMQVRFCVPTGLKIVILFAVAALKLMTFQGKIETLMRICEVDEAADVIVKADGAQMYSPG